MPLSSKECRAGQGRGSKESGGEGEEREQIKKEPTQDDDARNDTDQSTISSHRTISTQQPRTLIRPADSYFPPHLTAPFHRGPLDISPKGLPLREGERERRRG